MTKRILLNNTAFFSPPPTTVLHPAPSEPERRRRPVPLRRRLVRGRRPRRRRQGRLLLRDGAVPRLRVLQRGRRAHPEAVLGRAGAAGATARRQGMTGRRGGAPRLLAVAVVAAEEEEGPAGWFCAQQVGKSSQSACFSV